ncbi:MAG: aminopeptidase N, partial [Microbacteriaceae bacterium]|nr:aminopeptidase N [Microbacteriaceae bacterium]
MPGTNLTRVEAQERAAVVKTQRYEITLDLTQGAEQFGATTTVHFSGTPGADTFIDLIADEVHEVTLNGHSLDPAEVFADSRVTLPSLEAENTLTIVSDQRYMNTGEGLHRFQDPADGEVYLYSQFEVPDSRRMFAVFEQPDLKATFEFTVIAPSRWQVVSNQPTPESEPRGAVENALGAGVSEEVSVWRFEPTPIMSSYITAL